MDKQDFISTTLIDLESAVEGVQHFYSKYFGFVKPNMEKFTYEYDIIDNELLILVNALQNTTNTLLLLCGEVPEKWFLERLSFLSELSIAKALSEANEQKELRAYIENAKKATSD